MSALLSLFAAPDRTFREIPYKRVTSVMSTTTARTFTECCVKCLKTDGCQAVSVSQATNYVTCSLSDSTDTEEDPGSSVYLEGKDNYKFILNFGYSISKKYAIYMFLPSNYLYML